MAHTPNTSHLQSSTDGSNFPINLPLGVPTQAVLNNFMTTDAVGPYGNPDPKNSVIYTVASDGTPIIPVISYDNPIVTSVPPSSPPLAKFRKKDIYIVIAALALIMAGAIMMGVGKSSYESCDNKCAQQYLVTISLQSINNYNVCLDKCKKPYNALKGTGIALLVIANTATTKSTVNAADANIR
ncbi:1834_t:CDS:2 [Paraglomus brasilianum]|uniref:1834_t:CDS:1 n=1 Tax=Paraglomus brasilianum TaxID=144538 RepID=A0A9N9DBD3_9GLOM|nr:1834_t:CDS:2 [Paraglomus brasilianum]